MECGDFQIETMVFELGVRDMPGICTWSNCLYLIFQKEKFPFLKYPEYKEKGLFGSIELEGWDYNDDNDFYDLPFHRGISFYEEDKLNTENSKVRVTIGCDYMHLYDNMTVGKEDNGLVLLKTDGIELRDAFLELIEKKRPKKKADA